MRVRLVNPFLVEIERIDTTATAEDAQYDDAFNEPKTSQATGKRKTGTRYKDPIRLRAQVEDSVLTSLRQFNSGNSPESKIAFVIERRALVAADLVNETTGEPLLNVNDRLTGIYTEAGGLVHRVTPKPLYCIETRWISYGIARTLNLLLLRFNDRAIGAQV